MKGGSEMFNKKFRLIAVLCVCVLSTVSVSWAQDGPFPLTSAVRDPVGDAFSSVGFPIDLVGLAGGSDGRDLRIRLDFANRVRPFAELSLNSVGGTVGIDLDLSFLTGVSLPTSSFSPIGADIIVDLFSADVFPGEINVFGVDSTGLTTFFLGSAGVEFDALGIEILISGRLIGIGLPGTQDGGDIFLAAEVGNAVEATDFVPNRGGLRVNIPPTVIIGEGEGEFEFVFEFEFEFEGGEAPPEREVERPGAEGEGEGEGEPTPTPTLTPTPEPGGFQGIDIQLPGIRLPSIRLDAVATAVYGSATAPETDVFRSMRDEGLLLSSVGQEMVRQYYRLGPGLADVLSEHPAATRAVRETLDVAGKVLRTAGF